MSGGKDTLSALPQQEKTKLAYKILHCGWICALASELAAARAVLDEHHDSLPQDRRDHNNYRLGRIGTHNVAIACLPEGVIGVTSAAGVAEQMLWKRTRGPRMHKMTFGWET